ncbi:hypothetical protein cypCar_00048044 [Cyprinus carpio]|nr:hypothetical protein cypCar_00048044 [Cyprinus carpio]
MFSIDSKTGEIAVKGTIDYEDMKIFEMFVEAKDNGPVPLSGQCRVTVYVKDMNDNYPEITIKSLKNTVDENVPVGSVIALVGVSDRDTGNNGKVDQYNGEIRDHENVQLQRTRADQQLVVIARTTEIPRSLLQSPSSCPRGDGP